MSITTWSSRSPSAVVLLRGPVLAGALVAGLWSYVGAVDPAHSHVPLCPLHALTGLDCPFCGGTRGAHALVHGQFAQALHLNALTTFALPVVVALWVVLLVRRARGDVAASLLPRLARWHWQVVVAVVVLWGVVRNLPFATAYAP